MPYPFSQLPTFGRLKSVLEEYGCEFKTEFHIVNEDGASYPVTYFERVMPEGTLTCVVVIEDENERVELSFLRSICARLKIDPGIFGLTLDYLDEE